MLGRQKQQMTTVAVIPHPSDFKLVSFPPHSQHCHLFFPFFKFSVGFSLVRSPSG